MSVLPIENLDSGIGGGKAQGLTMLNCMSSQIPMSFVVRKYDEKAIIKLLNSLPQDTIFAIRSSADGEDSNLLSFAGQYQSFLNVKGNEEVLMAVQKCFASQEQMPVETYNKNFNSGKPSGMNVIIQEMIEAKASGVLFTCDPANNRHDKMSLTITKGFGEKLMSGHEDDEQFNFYKHAKILPESKILNKNTLKRLIDKALDIDSKFGRAAGLEWAIDKNDSIWWLQLQPITKLDNVHLNELDEEAFYEKPIYTRGNIGEMMPGPVTPLTLSTFARAIDLGLQVFYKKTGALDKISNEMLFVHSYYNHLFFDMNRLYEIVKKVGLSTKENIDFAIVGKLVPNINVKTEVNYFTSWLNFISMLGYINSATKSWKKLKRLNKIFDLDCPNDVKGCYELISNNLVILNKAYSLHYVTSSQSGSLYSAILNIFSGGQLPSMEDQKKTNALFSDIPDIVSAEVIKSLDKISSIIKADPLAQLKFVEANIDEANKYLQSIGPKNVKNAWSEFINRHGHRGVREAEMFEKEWALDPNPVIASIRAKTSLLIAGHNINGNNIVNTKQGFEGLSFFKKLIIKQILPKARKAVARREQTKAWSIGVQSRFKLAYRYLAKQLVKDGLLEDEEQIFFLKHQEIGKLIEGQKTDYWQSVCNKRRNIYPEMQKLSFEDLYFGIPVPMDEETKDHQGDLTGNPVSHGTVTAKIRVVKNIEDASKLKEGEIMVAQFTDVGWTPFYGIISGLITEIGSPLSHGAVVAREYGLPTIVSMKGATHILKTGQTIKLDAVYGKVEIINET